MPKVVLDKITNIELRTCLSIIYRKDIEINDDFDQEEFYETYYDFIEIMMAMDACSFILDTPNRKIQIRPKSLRGGKFEYTCEKTSIGNILQYLVMLGPFTGKGFDVTLYGSTNKENQLSVDCINYGLKDIMSKFGGPAFEMKITIEKRATTPSNDGIVKFTCKKVPFLKNIDLTNLGKVRYVRGISWAISKNPVVNKQVIAGAKDILKEKIPNSFIINHYCPGKDKQGKSPGHGLILVATTMDSKSIADKEDSSVGVSYIVDMTAPETINMNETLLGPEEFGAKAVKQLLRKIKKGGALNIDMFAPIVLCLMACVKKNYSSIIFGRPDSRIARVLKDIDSIVGIKFKISRMEKGMTGFRSNKVEEYLYFCTASGITNSNRIIY